MFDFLKTSFLKPKKKPSRTTRRVRTLPDVLPGLETLQSGLLRSTRPSRRAHEHFRAGEMDCPNSRLISESERSRLRSWCRMEFLDNPQAHNIARSFALGVYGQGPTLQFKTRDESLNNALEARFQTWRVKVGMDWLFHLALNQLFYDGESFFHFKSSPSGEDSIELIEARRIRTPYGGEWGPNHFEGIDYDGWTDQPIGYYVALECNNPYYGTPDEFVLVGSDRMKHLFIEDVVNQKRGLPMLQSALEMLSSMQRITNASLGAWELAAKQHLIIQTGMDAFQFLQCVPEDYDPDEGATQVKAFTTDPVPEDGGMTYLASGMSMSQVKNEHPNSQFGEHTQTFQKIAGLSAGLPENLATGSSANYNFSSARMDYQMFARFGGVCQGRLLPILRHCLFASLFYLEDGSPRTPEAAKLAELFPMVENWPIEWHFSNVLSSIDRMENASADVQLLQAGLLTQREYCKRYNIDYEQHMRDIAAASAAAQPLNTPTP